MRGSWSVIALAACSGSAAHKNTQEPIANARAKTPAPVVVASHRVHPGSLAADGSGAYWIEQGDTSWSLVHASGAAGAAPVALAQRSGHATSVVLEGDGVYFAADAPD